MNEFPELHNYIAVAFPPPAFRAEMEKNPEKAGKYCPLVTINNKLIDAGFNAR